MSVVQAKARPYGPALIDIQVEQGADFSLPLEVVVNALPADLTDSTIEAWMSNEFAAPGAQQIPLTIANDDLINGKFSVKFPAADSLLLTLPAPTQDAVEPLTTVLGSWIVQITDESGTVRWAEGQVYLDRSPWLT